MLVNAEHGHATLREIARAVEGSGFDSLWYADERFYHETYTGLAVCAAVTSRIRLGPAVTDPYTRHPAMTAAAITSLDELSGGRAVLGFGAGASGFESLGLRPTRPAATLRQSIELIRRLWGGEHVTMTGAVSLSDGYLKIPARAVPIYLAADGPRLLELAGELADGVITSHCVSPLILRPRLDAVERSARSAGRTARPPIVARVDVSVSRDRKAALLAAKVRLGRYLWARYPDIPYLRLHGLTLPGGLDRLLREAGPFRRTHELDLFRPFAEAIPDTFVDPLAIAGTPEEAGGRIRDLFAAGVDELMAYPLAPDGATALDAVEGLAAAVAVAQTLRNS